MSGRIRDALLDLVVPPERDERGDFGAEEEAGAVGERLQSAADRGELLLVLREGVVSAGERGEAERT
jgi:hypothetical protein